VSRTGARLFMAVAALLLACAGPVVGAATAGGLRATLEPRIIDELDTARLTIRATGTNQTTPLNLDALEEDFEVLTTRSSSQYRSVNGRVESWVEYQILLRPRRAGDLTVPPIQVGAAATEPLLLRVRGLTPDLRDTIERLVFFETEVSVDPVYVQAQTVLIRRLYYASGAQIYSDLPGMPEVEGAVVTPLGETVSSTSIRDGQRYGVIEQRFAIFPERSGELTIPAIAITSSVRLQTNGRTRRSGVRIATDPVTVTVLPVPAEYPPDQPWLPAESLTLSDTWSPDSAELHVGEPVSRTLQADVIGNGSSAIAPLPAALPDAHFRSYPEPPRRSDDASGSSLRGSRRETYSLIPTAPGTLSLPAVEVVWWDVSEHRLRTARTPGRELRITGSPVAAPRVDTVAAPDHVLPEPLSGSAAEPAGAPATDDRTPPAWLPGRLPIIGALCLLALAAAWALRRRLSAAMGLDGLRARFRDPTWQALRSACLRNDPADMHRALLCWLSHHYQTTTPAAVRAFRAAGHGAVLDRLTASLYRAGPATRPVSGQEVLAAAGTLRRRQRPAPSALPGLYD
jgi:hypothetical protein